MFNGCLDVSHNNGVVNWQAVKAAGYILAFVKATQGTKYVDPLFTTNRANAEAEGLMVVPYHFINVEPANLQSSHFLDVTNLKPHQASMLDWEHVTADSQRAPTDLVVELIYNIRLATKRDPLMYHGIYELSSPKINACPWHVPKYGPEPVNLPWLFWQNSPRGHVDGIKGFVDHDFFRGAQQELEAWFKDGTLPKDIAK